MGKYRFATLYPSTTATTAKTEPIDLDVTDPISQLMLVYKTKSAGTALGCDPAGDVSKVQLVDGSDVIASLSGYEVEGLDFYHRRKSPDTYLTDVDDVYTIDAFLLHFGRKLWDPDLALDPSQFRNLQLQVTHNYQTADASADDATLAVYAHMFDEKKITPVGYLRNVEVETFTSGANTSNHYTDLPRDLPIRMMMIRAAASDYYPWQVAHDIRIEENGGAKIPLEFNTSDWLKWANSEYGQVVQPCAIAVNATARDIYAMPTFTVEAFLQPSTVTNILSREVATTTIPFKFDITASDTCMGHLEGFCPHYCFPIPFGVQDDMADWYDPTPLGSLRMRVTAGSAGTNGTVATVLQQLKKY